MNIHPRAAFASKNYRRFFCSRVLGITAHGMLSVTLGQYIYERTHDPLILGYIGLCFFLPRVLLVLLAGHVADRFSRRLIGVLCASVRTLMVLGILLWVASGVHPVWQLYGLLVVIGSAWAFDGPAHMALMPQLVPLEHFANAVTWNSQAVQIAYVVGPMCAGIGYAWGGAPAMLVAILGMQILATCGFLSLRVVPVVAVAQAVSWRSVLAGLRHVRTERIIFAVMSLDLFAVLFGGAVALMPMYANDILMVGPRGLGWLRAAPAVGAIAVAWGMVHRPHFTRPGFAMLWAVLAFAAATIGFGLSRNIFLSLALLMILGASDMIGMIVRGVIVQTLTPDHMRGRVSAVNLIFIGASNELGEFESGVTARWWGVVPATVIGGLCTMAVVALWAWRFPQLRTYRARRSPQTS